jgi:hypothetical protein
MLETKRKKGESFESMMRRHSRRILRSRLSQRVRAKQHVAPKKSKLIRKERALHGKKLREKKEYLKKIGKLVEEVRK